MALAICDTSSEPYNPTMEPLRGSSNFYPWKSLTTFHLNHLGLWDITSGKTPRPPSPSSGGPTPEQRTWDAAVAGGQYFLLCHVESPIKGLINRFTTAAGMWKELMSWFHRRDASSLLWSLRDVSCLRSSDVNEESFAEHLLAFDDAWNHLRMRTIDAAVTVAGTPDSLETALSVLARSEESKIAFLVASVPLEMWTMVQNLRTSHVGVVPYSLVYNRLLHMHGELEFLKQECEEQELALEEPDCTWCRSRGLKSEGHEWKQCGRLRKFKRGKWRRAK